MAYFYSSCEIAPTGQIEAQAPHLIHFFWSIIAFPSTIEMAPTGHIEAQAPQPTHLSLLTFIISPLKIYIIKYT